MRRIDFIYGMDIFFSQKSGIRHFIMLGISVVLAIWTYYLVSFIAGPEWLTKIFTDAHSGWEAFAEIGLTVALVGCFGILVYWCCRLWMLRFLLNAFLLLFGWFPLIWRLTPEFWETSRGLKIKLKRLNKKIRKADPQDPRLPEWSEKAVQLEQELQQKKIFDQEDAAQTKRERYLEEKQRDKEDRRAILSRLILYPEEGLGMAQAEVTAQRGAEKMAGCLLSPFTLLQSLLGRILLALGYLLGSIGIPVLTPVFMLILAFVINLLCGQDPVITSIVAIVLMVILVCTLIIHPIVAIIRKPKYDW